MNTFYKPKPEVFIYNSITRNCKKCGCLLDYRNEDNLEFHYEDIDGRYLEALIPHCNDCLKQLFGEE